MTEDQSASRFRPAACHRVVLVKGDHSWRFVWEPGDEASAVEAIAEIARSPQVDFDWFDAAMVCHEMSRITASAA
ncbi:MAG: hypothetical protein QGH76_04860 [Phycisphaerales bacterium]|nr:hypothetical protein [Phycisphaerales bacterium]